MSESGWGAPAWGGGEGQREALPKVESLPIAEQGYDREAVREAFDAFYRHAAQLDATLRILESVEAFSRQSRELRADIRSLRAASWGPAPSARHVWSVGHEVWSPEEPPGALVSSLPRLVVWSALIIAVGVGAALAELRTLVIVGLVLGAWLLVGLIELALAGRRGAPAPAPLTPEAPAAAEPTFSVPASAPAVTAQETMVAAPQPVLAPPAQEAKPEPEAEPDVEVEPEVEPEPDVEVEPAVDHAVEPAPEVDAEVEPEADPAAVVPPARRRFWRRAPGPQAGDAEDTDPQLASPLAEAGWRNDEPEGDPWQAAVEEDGERPPLEPAGPPARGLLRRGRR